MKLHREGNQTINITFMLTAILVMAINLISPIQTFVHVIAYIIILKILFIIIYFFRVPKRDYIYNEDLILSSADGKVVAIEEVFENEYFKDKRIQISVFMSVYNVHINWVPFSGYITYHKYHPGKYIIASHPKSSELNERTTIVVKDNKGNEVLIRQIAGALARRVVCYAKQGDYMQQSSELGFIKFGSRVDFFLPIDSEIKVKLGQKVRGGIDTIAVFRQS